MLSGRIQLAGETINSVKVHEICKSLDNHFITTLSLRDCDIDDADFTKLLKSVGRCRSITRINLNNGLLTGPLRLEALLKAIVKNTSLQELLVHGNPLCDDGIQSLCAAVSKHPRIQTLDIGDCSFGDVGIGAVCELLPPNGALFKSGLQDLTLSDNPAISSVGWARFAIAMSAGCQLRSLYLDYNDLGDYGGSCIAVAVASHRSLEVLDVENTDITDHTAQLFLHLTETYTTCLRQVVLSGNRVKKRTVEAIKHSLLSEKSPPSGEVTHTGEQAIIRKETLKAESSPKMMSGRKSTEKIDQLTEKERALHNLMCLMNGEEVLDKPEDIAGAEEGVISPIVKDQVVEQNVDKGMATLTRLTQLEDLWGENEENSISAQKASPDKVITKKPKGKQKTRTTSEKQHDTKSSKCSNSQRTYDPDSDWGEELREIPIQDLGLPLEYQQHSWVSFIK